VAPDLADDTAATLAEARALWAGLARPNVMIKVPGTPAGLSAIRTLVAEGINVNITLLFSRETYRQVALAYIDGLQARVARGLPIEQVASVASFFVSRIDTVVDKLLAQKVASAGPAERPRLEGLFGKAAIANAKLAYRIYKDLFGSSPFVDLARSGARTQRVLWASTSAKDPRYRDVMYVEELIGPDTIDTMPPETMAAFRDHGRVRDTLETGLREAEDTLAALGEAGISLEAVAAALVDEGIKKFDEPFQAMLKGIQRRSADRRVERREERRS